MWKAGKALAWRERYWESCMGCSMWETFFSLQSCAVQSILCTSSTAASNVENPCWCEPSKKRSGGGHHHLARRSNEIIPPLNWKWYLHTIPHHPTPDHHHTPQSQVPHSGKNSLGGFKAGCQVGQHTLWHPQWRYRPSSQTMSLIKWLWSGLHFHWPDFFTHDLFLCSLWIENYVTVVGSGSFLFCFKRISLARTKGFGPSYWYVAIAIEEQFKNSQKLCNSMLGSTLAKTICQTHQGALALVGKKNKP